MFADIQFSWDMRNFEKDVNFAAIIKIIVLIVARSESLVLPDCKTLTTTKLSQYISTVLLAKSFAHILSAMLSIFKVAIGYLPEIFLLAMLNVVWKFNS